MTRILKLQAENIKRLKAIEITPQGNVVVVGGRNGQGKSSTLDAIWYALGGAGSMPSEPLRKGEDAGFAKLELDNGLIVTRRITDKGTTLKVETKDGVLKSPQAVLDRMVGSISFDPMAFVRMDPKKQLETLRKMVGVDTSGLDAERAQAYAKRTDANRLLKEIKDQAAALPEVAPDTPDEYISVSALMEEMAEIDAETRNHDHLLRNMASAELEVGNLKTKIANLKQEMVEAERLLDHMRSQLAKSSPRDGAGIRQRIRSADEVNQAVRNRRRGEDLQRRIKAGEALVRDFTSALDQIDSEKTRLIAEASFPVDGLSFGDDGVRFNGVPFEQASSAEQTRVSVGMALAMNPDLKVLLVRDGSLLDEESFALLAKMAAEADAQVWVEAVTTDRDKCAVVIEDGTVQVAP